MRMTRNLIFDVSACCVNEKKTNFFLRRKRKQKNTNLVFFPFFLSFFQTEAFCVFLPQTIKHSFLSLKRSFRAIRGGRARDDDDTD